MSILNNYQFLSLIIVLICFNIKFIFAISNSNSTSSSNYNNHKLSVTDINTYIIHLHVTHSHDDIKNELKSHNLHQDVNIKHYHYHAIHGMTISLPGSPHHHVYILEKMTQATTKC